MSTSDSFETNIIQNEENESGYLLDALIEKKNECPKKGKKKEETQILKIAYDLGYDPIEDSDVDLDIEIYGYTSGDDEYE